MINFQTIRADRNYLFIFSVYYSLGSGSDMATFYQRAGVPSIDMWFTYDEVSSEGGGGGGYMLSDDCIPITYSQFVILN